MNKIFILSVFPAPYRVSVIKTIKDALNADVFFERMSDDNRNKDWFVNENWFSILTNDLGRERYKKAIKNFNNYNLFVFYDYSSIESIKLIFRCILHKKKYIINCDGALLTPNYFKDFIKRILIKNAYLYFASGKSAKDYFLYYGAKEEKIFIHPFTTLKLSDINPQALTRNEKDCLKKSLGIKGELTALAVGRFIKLKNYDLLIEAWKNISEKLHLYIVGGGEEKENYMELISSLKLKNIHLIDYLDSSVLKKYYNAADLFIHPTSTDVWGLVINEAMASGLPIISTDKCVAAVELINNGENGFVVLANDSQVLSDKINLLFSDELMREKMSINNLERIREYTEEKMCSIHLELIKKVLDNQL